METSVEALEDNRAKVTVTIDSNTVDARIKKQYKDFANRYNFPGFRRGKAPRPVVDSMLGKEAVPAMVTDELVNDTYPLTFDEAGIFPVGEPQFDEDMGMVKEGEAYVYSYEIATKPTYELSSYEPVEIKMPANGATDEEIDAEIASMAEHYYDVVDCPDDAEVKADSFVNLHIVATDDNGDNIESISTDTTQYGLGSGLYPAAYDEQLIGLKKGDTKQFTIDMPSEPTAMISSLMGKTAHINFDIEVLSVKERKAPEVTDEWVKQKLGLETVAELRDELKETIESQKGSMLPRLKESRSLNALGERLQGEPPEAMVEEAETNLLQDFYRQLQAQGMTFDSYLQLQGMTSAQFRDDVKKQAADVSKQNLALDAWAEHYEIQASDQDIKLEFTMNGATNADELLEQWRESGQLYMLRQSVLRKKASDDVMDKAVVTEETEEDEKALEEEVSEETATDEADETIEEAPEEAAAEADEAVEDAPEAEADEQ